MRPENVPICVTPDVRIYMTPNMRIYITPNVRIYVCGRTFRMSRFFKYGFVYFVVVPKTHGPWRWSPKKVWKLRWSWNFPKQDLRKTFAWVEFLSMINLSYSKIQLKRMFSLGPVLGNFMTISISKLSSGTTFRDRGFLAPQQSRRSHIWKNGTSEKFARTHKCAHLE